MPDFFSPLTALLGTLLAGAHALATTIGLSGAADWVVAIALLTCAVRLVLLPLAISGAKHARAAAKAAPAMRELQAKYAGKRDQESIKAMMQERKAIQAEHGMSAAGCLPVLLQMPVFLSLYHLIMKVTDGKRVGALSNQAVGSASLLRSGGPGPVLDVLQSVDARPAGRPGAQVRPGRAAGVTDDSRQRVKHSWGGPEPVRTEHEPVSPKMTRRCPFGRPLRPGDKRHVTDRRSQTVHSDPTGRRWQASVD
ncbi:membrane protein insertase YidC [Yimella sp. NH-Cas1]|uniref:membrane protein insertase YidC n=1 Tax=Yimella sp. NH-Cas1 TaxID=2917726 RepID=UPI001EFC02E5|nr:membrane protein insertase YidC [Yimella sp. NH-Cas1]MCG8655258.1 membrane protein insertase YidC [Yimella sp. NH-Cas1]